MRRVCCAPFATFTFCPDRHVSPLLLSHPSKGWELICMTQCLSHTNKHRTNWLCCATYQLPRQSEQPQRFLFVYGGTARCVSSTRKHIIAYYTSITRSLQWRTGVNDNKQEKRWCNWIIYLYFKGSDYIILPNEARCQVLCLGPSQVCVGPFQGAHRVTAKRRCKSKRMSFVTLCFLQLDLWFYSHYAALNEFFWLEKLRCGGAPEDCSKHECWPCKTVAEVSILFIQQCSTRRMWSPRTTACSVYTLSLSLASRYTLVCALSHVHTMTVQRFSRVFLG